MNGILVAMTVMNWTFASSGSWPCKRPPGPRARHPWLARAGPAVGLRHARLMPLGHLGVCVADVDLPAGDVVLAPFEGERLGQAGDCVFGRGVWRAIPGAGLCAEIEPLLMIRPPRGRWARMIRDGLLGAQEGAGQVGGDRLRPVVVADLIDCPPRPGQAGVVDQQVEPPERGRYRLEEGADRVRVGNVGRQRDREIRLSGRLTQCVLLAAGQRDPPTAGEQDPGDASPDPQPAPVTTAHVVDVIKDYLSEYWPCLLGRRPDDAPGRRRPAGHTGYRRRIGGLRYNNASYDRDYGFQRASKKHLDPDRTVFADRAKDFGIIDQLAYLHSCPFRALCRCFALPASLLAFLISQSR